MVNNFPTGSHTGIRSRRTIARAVIATVLDSALRASVTAADARREALRNAEAAFRKGYI